MTTAYTPTDPGYRDRLRETLEGQPMMQLFGVTLEQADPGDVTLGLAHSVRLQQHHGFLHGGITAMLTDAACGLGALSLVGPNQSVVTSDLSITYVRPGVGTRYQARATVVRPGRNLTNCRCDVVAFADDSSQKLIAIAQATTMTLDRR